MKAKYKVVKMKNSSDFQKKRINLEDFMNAKEILIRVSGGSTCFFKTYKIGKHDGKAAIVVTEYDQYLEPHGDKVWVYPKNHVKKVYQDASKANLDSAVRSINYQIDVHDKERFGGTFIDVEIVWKKASAKPRKAPSSSDKKRIALPPGKRISKNGNVYYESRVNRSDTAEERKTHGVKSVDVLRRTIKPYENKIRDLDYEWIYCVNKYGKLDYHKTDHHPSSVSVWDMPENLAMATHNHPSSSPFSFADLATAVRQNIGEMRVASKYYDYYIRSKDGDWGFSKSRYKNRDNYGSHLAQEYSKVNDKLTEKYQAYFNDELERRILSTKKVLGEAGLKKLHKEVTRDIGRIQMHESWIRFAEDHNIEYKRIERKGVKAWQLPKS